MMTKSVKRMVFIRRANTVAFAVVALSQAAVAQVAGGSLAGGGAPPGPDFALLNAPTGPLDLPRCIHRHADLSNVNENRLSVWLSVRQPASANIKIGASSIDAHDGTLALIVLSNGIPVATSREVRGTDTLFASLGASVKLVPGRQYKITAKATVSDKKHSLLDMSVAVGGTCP